MNSFYSENELLELGFKSYGKQVLISRKCSIYAPQNIVIGDNVRIDDFCILSGNITLGSNIHISAYCALYGSHGIILEDYTGMSPRSTIFSACDDFSGNYLIGPIHDKKFTNVTGGVVKLQQYVQLGAGTTVMPNITIGEGAVTGAMTFVNKDIKEWTINVGIPCKTVKSREKKLLILLESNTYA